MVILDKFARGRSTVGSRKEGFSLVEVMVAFTVLVMCIGGGLVTLTSGYRQLDTARCSTLAAQIMQSRIETLRLMNWTKIQGETSKTFTTAEMQNLVPTEAADVIKRFTLSQTVALDAVRNMETIVLKVTWTDQSNLAHERTFSMRYAKNGLYDFYIKTP